MDGREDPPRQERRDDEDEEEGPERAEPPPPAAPHGLRPAWFPHLKRRADAEGLPGLRRPRDLGFQQSFWALPTDFGEVLKLASCWKNG